MSIDTVLIGDCRETLKTIDEKVRMVVTSPPYYGLRNYGDEDNQTVHCGLIWVIVITTIDQERVKH